MTSTKHKTTMLAAIALGLLLAILLAALVSSAPADAAVTSGKAYGWGGNYDGQLGNGTSGPGTDANTPVAVGNLSGVKSVKAGCGHGLALKTDGTVRAWGSNGYGVLGDGTNDPSDVPVRVKIDNVMAISAGCTHNLALKENGTVWAWGDNEYGELGNGQSGPGANSNVPVRVANIGTDAKGIAAGQNFSLALMKDGTVRSWGDNYHGQLGNGTSENYSDVPVAVQNLTAVKNIDGGYGFTLAVTQ